MKNMVIMILILSTLMGGGTDAAVNTKPAFPIDGVIANCERASIYSRPDADSQVLAVAGKNEQVRVVSNAPHSDGKYYYVDVSYHGKSGYLQIIYLDVILPESMAKPRSLTTIRARDTTDDLLLRRGPGQNYSVMGYLFGGEHLDYSGETEGSWYHASYYGQSCWIHKNYVKVYTWQRSDLYVPSAPSPTPPPPTAAPSPTSRPQTPEAPPTAAPSPTPRPQMPEATPTAAPSPTPRPQTPEATPTAAPLSPSPAPGPQTPTAAPHEVPTASAPASAAPDPIPPYAVRITPGPTRDPYPDDWDPFATASPLPGRTEEPVETIHGGLPSAEDVVMTYLDALNRKDEDAMNVLFHPTAGRMYYPILVLKACGLFEDPVVIDSFTDPAAISPMASDPMYQIYLQLANHGADRVRDMAALVRVGGEEYVFSILCAEDGGEWYAYDVLSVFAQLDGYGYDTLGFVSAPETLN